MQMGGYAVVASYQSRKGLSSFSEVSLAHPLTTDIDTCQFYVVRAKESKFPPDEVF